MLRCQTRHQYTSFPVLSATRYKALYILNWISCKDPNGLQWFHLISIRDAKLSSRSLVRSKSRLGWTLPHRSVKFAQFHTTRCSHWQSYDLGSEEYCVRCVTVSDLLFVRSLSQRSSSGSSASSEDLDAVCSELASTSGERVEWSGSKTARFVPCATKLLYLFSSVKATHDTHDTRCHQLYTSKNYENMIRVLQLILDKDRRYLIPIGRSFGDQQLLFLGHVLMEASYLSTGSLSS